MTRLRLALRALTAPPHRVTAALTAIDPPHAQVGALRPRDMTAGSLGLCGPGKEQ